MNTDRKLTILVADTDTSTVESTTLALKKNGYKTLQCRENLEIIESLKKVSVDLVLLGITMPPIGGVELYRKILESNPRLPVVLLAPVGQLPAAISALKKGAHDIVITPPFDEGYLIRVVKKTEAFIQASQVEARYQSMLEAEVLKRTEAYNELVSRSRLTSREMVQHLLAAAEFRDDETGNHVKRIGMFALLLSAQLGMDSNFKEIIAVASSMHDIGKIGIPDSVLLKPSGLSPIEFETMKKHTKIGHDILAGSSNAYLKMAATIALGHHERYDGTGYPQGTKGGNIPMECKIVMLCDQYDALRSKRPYKEPFDHAKTTQILTRGDGRTKPEHFDPRVIAAFEKVAPIFDKMFDANCGP